jgi:beta-glucosidase
MAKRNRGSCGALRRRDFLALATAGAVAVVTGWPESKGGGETLPAIPGGEAQPLDTGGIAREHFENARKRATAMVAKLTLAEKISQFGSTAPAVPRVGLPAFKYYGSEALHGLIHDGPITSFPLPLALGCSWNRSLVQRVFTAVSDEIWAWHKKDGQSLAMFSPPTVNMGTRDPRWGRIAENYSEDPYLVGQMAIYTIHGMQGHDSRYLKTIACAKHFIANDTENDREVTSATVDPRSFWEYYTRGFEACVREGHVFTVMSSYNAMNGIPTTANRTLLTDVLRDRWGFRGYVVSDCDAVGDIYRTHHFVPTYAEAAALAVNAGCDINCGDTLEKHLGEAVDEMLISESVLDQSLIRSFTGRVLLGEFDPPEQNPYSKTPISCLESPAHQQLAREAARQSIVLFKNHNNTLPLDKGRVKKIAIIGPMADVCQLGNYSGMPKSRLSPRRGINEYLGIPSGPTYHKRASDFAQVAGGPRLENCSEGGEDLTDISHGSWAAFPDVLFNGATEFHARVASYTAGGTIEVHLDSLSGPLVSKLKVPNTGGWQNWVSVNAPTTPVNSEHAVYLRFVGGPEKLFNLQSFNLTPAAPFAGQGNAATEVAYALGCSVLGEKDPAQYAEAVKAAREADVALVFVGADEQVAREGCDRSYLHLPGVQHELVQAVYAANPRTILVISSNCPVAVNWEQDNLPAIVGGLFLGEQQGYALAEVLFGDYNPGGKVSTTWYRRVEDLPDFHDYNIRHGRTYMYFRGIPLYPFGHGLSYTTFQYKDLRVSDNTLKPAGKVTILLDVTNSGTRDGDEIVQLYVRFAGGRLERPIKQLVNFDRVHIKAGETRTVSFELAYENEALRYWDETKYEFAVEPGPLNVMVGASSADIRLKEELQLSS